MAPPPVPDEPRPRGPAADATGGPVGGEAQPPGPASGGPGYEQARDELGDVVRRLESGGVGLEESLQLWERGEYLVQVCQQWLDGARTRLAAVRGERS